MKLHCLTFTVLINLLASHSEWLLLVVVIVTVAMLFESYWARIILLFELVDYRSIRLIHFWSTNSVSKSSKIKKKITSLVQRLCRNHVQIFAWRGYPCKFWFFEITLFFVLFPPEEGQTPLFLEEYYLVFMTFTTRIPHKLEDSIAKSDRANCLFFLSDPF